MNTCQYLAKMLTEIGRAESIYTVLKLDIRQYILILLCLKASFQAVNIMNTIFLENKFSGKTVLYIYTYIDLAVL